MQLPEYADSTRKIPAQIRKLFIKSCLHQTCVGNSTALKYIMEQQKTSVNDDLAKSRRDDCSKCGVGVLHSRLYVRSCYNFFPLFTLGNTITWKTMNISLIISVGSAVDPHWFQSRIQGFDDQKLLNFTAGKQTYF